MKRTLLIALIASAVLAPSAGAATVSSSRVAQPSQLQTTADAYARLEAAHPTDQIRWCKRLGRDEVECHLVFFYPHHETIIAADGLIIEAEVEWPGWRQIVVTPSALHQVAIEGFEISG